LLARPATFGLNDDLGDILILEALFVDDLSLAVDHGLPVSLVLIDQVLDLEANTGAQFRAVAVREDRR
jgi:hypothetical protein